MRKRKATKMTRKQLDRALIKLFDCQVEAIPRTRFSRSLYDYVQAKWARTERGRAWLK